MPIERYKPSGQPRRRREEATARELLDASTLCAIATVTADGRGHLNYRLLRLEPRTSTSSGCPSRRRDTHATSARNDSRRSPYMTRARRGASPTGVSSSSVRRVLSGAEDQKSGRGTTRSAFPTSPRPISAPTASTSSDSRRLKLFDERALGGGTFVTARLTRDRRSPGTDRRRPLRHLKHKPIGTSGAGRKVCDAYLGRRQTSPLLPPKGTDPRPCGFFPANGLFSGDRRKGP